MRNAEYSAKLSEIDTMHFHEAFTLFKSLELFSKVDSIEIRFWSRIEFWMALRKHGFVEKTRFTHGTMTFLQHARFCLLNAFSAENSC